MNKITTREVVDAKFIADYVVDLTFDDLKVRRVDLRRFLSRGIFRALVDPKEFRQFKVDAELGTIVWPNGADLAPDVLYSEPEAKIANSQAKKELSNFKTFRATRNLKRTVKVRSKKNAVLV